MNISELKAKLDKARVVPTAYSLEGGTLIEGYVLSQDRNRWVVYYTERGEKYESNFFDSESTACNFFFDFIIDDPSVLMQ